MIKNKTIVYELGDSEVSYTNIMDAFHSDAVPLKVSACLITESLHI